MSNNLSKELAKAINKNCKEEDIAYEKLTQDGSPSDVKRFVSTGSTILDYAIANQKNGGVPVGKICSISGLQGSGKTLLAMQICANAQKDGAYIVYMDTEDALNTNFAKRVGLDVEKDFLYIRPRSIEQVFTSLYEICRKMDELEKENKIKYPYVVVIWDSIAATKSEVDINSENPDPTATVGLIPRILSKNIYTFLHTAGRRNIAQIFINQLRTNIKAMPFQDKYTEPGGNSIPFAASTQIRLSKGEKLKTSDTNEVVGINTVAEVRKTRFGPNFRKATFPIYYTKGVDNNESMINYLIDNKLICQANMGAKGKVIWFEQDGKESAINRLEFKRKVRSDQKFKEKLLDLVDKCLTRDMIDPEDAELSVVDD